MTIIYVFFFSILLHSQTLSHFETSPVQFASINKIKFESRRPVHSSLMTSRIPFWQLAFRDKARVLTLWTLAKVVHVRFWTNMNITIEHIWKRQMSPGFHNTRREKKSRILAYIFCICNFDPIHFVTNK